MKCPRCQQENPPQAKFCLGCGAPVDGAIPSPKSYADLKGENEGLRRSLGEAHAQVSEALARETATRDILRVISRSPGDIQPVFDAIVQSAVRLCEGLFGTVLRLEGDRLYLAAHHNLSPAGLQAYREHYPVVVHLRETVASGAILDRRVVQVIDSTDQEVPPRSLAMARATGFRGVVVVPMLRDGEPIGVINVARRERGPFTDRHVALLQTFAAQAVIAIENVRLFTELKDKNHALAEALEQQTATAEILRVISSSPTDYQPVFDTIVRTAGLVCGAVDAVLWTTDGGELVVRAHHGPLPATIGARQPMHGSVAGYAVCEARVVHVKDLTEADDFPVGRDLARRLGWRTTLSAPLLREAVAIGAILIRRSEVRPFTDQQITLLQTFADQAVIAIENVRLFTELQEKNEALTGAHAQVSEALEQQTATSEILRVISQSPTDIQPVFDTIVRNAVRLCGAIYGTAYRIDRDVIDLVAHMDLSGAGWERFRMTFPRPLRDGGVLREVFESRRLLYLPDVDEYPFSEAARAMLAANNARSLLTVPMIRQDRVVGAFSLFNQDENGFSDTRIALVQTFADQAVIAIENVRLFKELEARNRDLTAALEQQTATAEILRVIASSPTDLRRVLDAVAEAAARLCEATDVLIHRVEGDTLPIAASAGTFSATYQADEHFPIDRGSVVGRAILERRTIHVHDLAAESDHEFPVARAFQRRYGHRTVLTTPLVREGVPLGAIWIRRTEVRPFTEEQVALLETFADQAVIAIENVRLFKELQARTQQLTRSVEQLTALREIGQAVSSSLDLETVLNTIVGRAVELAGARSGTIWEYDSAAEEFVLRITQNVEDPELRAHPDVRVRRGEGAVGQLAVSQRPVQIPDITDEGAYEGRLRDSLVGAGTRALLAIPLLHEAQLLGGLVISRRTPGEFPAEVVDLLASFATQSALAIQNARLFLEIADKSRQLEVASRHKSEFLANMSHELRTPLNAIIGFSEVLNERMFGELNEKQEEYLKDIHASGQHLLSLINDILDLSKIEAGRMELELSEFHLPAALDNALTLVRERAGRRGIALGLTVDERLDHIRADERKVRQVVLNLLSNAIKFTPEGGRIDVRASLGDGGVEVSVTDTGVGIAPEDQEAIFEEFRQVGTAAKKVEGTGLGLALSRKFIELHGGRIWVQSQVGKGSTFRFTLPMS